MLGVLALATVSMVSGRSVMKGLAMACVGLILAMVGQDPATAKLRFTFGQLYLFDGLPVVPIILGLFAVPALVLLMLQPRGSSIASRDEGDLEGGERMGVNGALQGALSALRHWSLLLRCSAIGIFFGVLPGVGSGSAQWVAYGHAKQTSKNPERFGKGAEDGVVAPGAVNNATDSAMLVPTVAFGVPGSGSMAILLGAFVITGIAPGPDMLDEHLDVTFSMVWTMIISNLVVVAVAFLLLRRIAALTRVKVTLLMPALLIFVVIGAYATTNAPGDIVVMLCCGAFTLLALRFGWPIPPVLLGFILGKMLEDNLFVSYSLSEGYGWLKRPIVVALAVVTCLIIIAGIRQGRRARPIPAGAPVLETHGLFISEIGLMRDRHVAGGTIEAVALLREEHPRPVGTPTRIAQSCVASTFSLLGAFALYELHVANDFSHRAKMLPTLVAVVLMVLAVGQLWAIARNMGTSAAVEPERATNEDASWECYSLPRILAVYGANFGAVVVTAWAVGFVIGLPVFVFAYLRLISREKVRVAVVGALVSWAFLYYVLDQLVHVPLGAGAVFQLG